MTDAAPLAVTMGEPAGIGGELTLKAWSRRRPRARPFFALDDPGRLRAGDRRRDDSCLLIPEQAPFTRVGIERSDRHPRAPPPRERAQRPVGDGIGLTVNAVTPGYIATDMVATIPDKVMDRIRGQIPLGRLGQPEEIARVVCFLAADQSAYLTGQIWAVNGGLDM